MFIYEYGVDAYNRWRDICKTAPMSLRQYEIALRKAWKLTPEGSPIMDEYERDNR